MKKLYKILIKIFRHKIHYKAYPIYIWPATTPVQIKISGKVGEIIAVDIQHNHIIQYKIAYFDKLVNETIVIWLYEEEFEVIKNTINIKQGLGFKVSSNN